MKYKFEIGQKVRVVGSDDWGRVVGRRFVFIDFPPPFIIPPSDWFKKHYTVILTGMWPIDRPITYVNIDVTDNYKDEEEIGYLKVEFPERSLEEFRKDWGNDGDRDIFPSPDQPTGKLDLEKVLFYQ